MLDEARSSALRVLGHHAVLAPGTLATHFGGVCVQLLKPGVDAAVASILVLVDLLDVMFDVFGDDATDPVFRSLGTFFLVVFPAQHHQTANLFFFFLNHFSPVFPLCARSPYVAGWSVAARGA